MKLIKFANLILITSGLFWNCEEGFESPIKDELLCNENVGSIVTLEAPFPNPLNRDKSSAINIIFDIHEILNDNAVNIIVENIVGDLITIIVRDISQRGLYQVNWDTRNNNGDLVKSGIYSIRISASGCGSERKFIEIVD